MCYLTFCLLSSYRVIKYRKMLIDLHMKNAHIKWPNYFRAEKDKHANCFSSNKFEILFLKRFFLKRNSKVKLTKRQREFSCIGVAVGRRGRTSWSNIVEPLSKRRAVEPLLDFRIQFRILLIVTNHKRLRRCGGAKIGQFGEIKVLQVWIVSHKYKRTCK